MQSISVEPLSERRKGFWIASALAFLLALLTWVNPIIIDRLNGLLCAGCSPQYMLNGVQRFNDIGAYVYIAFRLCLVGLLLGTILRFPRSQAAVATARRGEAAPVRTFDPLMGLRTLACFLVLMGHYFLVVFPFRNNGVPTSVRVLLRSSPWAGVWLFFTLSGYLMGKGFVKGRYSLDEAGAFLFFRNRLLRIMPIYVSSILLISIYRYPTVLHLRHWWMLIEMMIFDYRGDLPVNPIGALWSVSTEVQFYLLVPALVVILLSLRQRCGKAFAFIPVLLLAFGTAARLWLTLDFPRRSASFSYSYIYSPLISNLDIFLAGMSVNLIPRRKISSERGRHALALGLWIAGLGFYAGVSGFSYYMIAHYGVALLWTVAPVICALFAAAFIYAAEHLGKVVLRGNVFGKILLGIEGIGILTYCLYVFHPEIYFVNAGLVPATQSLRVSLLHFPYVMLQVFAVAAFFYFAVEKPFDTKKRVSGTALLDPP